MLQKGMNPMDKMDPQAEKYLDELFQRTQGSIDAQVSMFDIGAVMGLEKEASRRMAEDLIAEGLVEIKTLSGGIGITRQGIEQAQDSGGGAAGAGISLGKGPLLEEQERRALDAVLNGVKNHLANHPTAFTRLEEMVIDIKTIDVQLLSPHPKTEIIRAVLHSLKDGFDGAAGSSSAAEDLKKLIGT
jgi:hypothetical protein